MPAERRVAGDLLALEPPAVLPISWRREARESSFIPRWTSRPGTMRSRRRRWFDPPGARPAASRAGRRAGRSGSGVTVPRSARSGGHLPRSRSQRRSWSACSASSAVPATPRAPSCLGAWRHGTATRPSRSRWRSLCGGSRASPPGPFARRSRRGNASATARVAVGGRSGDGPATCSQVASSAASGSLAASPPVLPGPSPRGLPSLPPAARRRAIETCTSSNESGGEVRPWRDGKPTNHAAQRHPHKKAPARPSRS